MILLTTFILSTESEYHYFVIYQRKIQKKLTCIEHLEIKEMIAVQFNKFEKEKAVQWQTPEFKI